MHHVPFQRESNNWKSRSFSVSISHETSSFRYEFKSSRNDKMFLRNALYYSSHDERKQLYSSVWSLITNSTSDCYTSGEYERQIGWHSWVLGLWKYLFQSDCIIGRKKGALISEAQRASQTIRPRDIQLLALNEDHSVPQMHQKLVKNGLNAFLIIRSNAK